MTNAVCSGCNGMGYTDVRNGDDDQPCKVCGGEPDRYPVDMTDVEIVAMYTESNVTVALPLDNYMRRCAEQWRENVGRTLDREDYEDMALQNYVADKKAQLEWDVYWWENR